MFDSSQSYEEGEDASIVWKIAGQFRKWKTRKLSISANNWLLSLIFD